MPIDVLRLHARTEAGKPAVRLESGSGWRLRTPVSSSSLSMAASSEYEHKPGGSLKFKGGDDKKKKCASDLRIGTDEDCV